MNFWEIMNERGNAIDVAIAIRGFGRFAGPILLYMGEQVIKTSKIVFNLFRFSDFLSNF
jgi:hypothetical protein